MSPLIFFNGHSEQWCSHDTVCFSADTWGSVPFSVPWCSDIPGPLQGQLRLIKSQPVGDTQRLCINNHSFIFQEGSHLLCWRPLPCDWSIICLAPEPRGGGCLVSMQSSVYTWRVLPLWFPHFILPGRCNCCNISLNLKQTVALLSQLGRSSSHQAPFRRRFSSRPAPLSCLRPLWKINKKLEVTDALREIEDGEYLGERGWSGAKNGGDGYPGWWDLKAVSTDLKGDTGLNHAPVYMSLDFSLVLFYCSVCQCVERSFQS